MSNPVSSIKSDQFEPKKQLRPGSRVCQCASCEEYFTGLEPFDKHLTRHKNPNTPHDCKTPTQMRAAGLVQNVNGVWKGAGK